MFKVRKLYLLVVLLAGAAFGVDADAQRLVLGCSQIALGQKLQSEATIRWTVSLPADTPPSFAPDAFRVTLDVDKPSANATGMPFLTPGTPLRLQAIKNGFVIHTEPHANAVQTDSTITFTENRTTGVYVLRQDLFSIQGSQHVASGTNWWVGTCIALK